MSRVYPGLYSVLVVWIDDDGREVYAHTEPDVYEEAEKLALLVGLGVPFEGRRIVRALIVGPVAGSVE